MKPFLSFFLLLVVFSCKNKSNTQEVAKSTEALAAPIPPTYYHNVIMENVFPGSGKLEWGGGHQADNNGILKKGVYTHKSIKYNVYYFSVDSLAEKEYIDLIHFNFIVPNKFDFKNLRNAIPDTITVVSDYYQPKNPIPTDTFPKDINLLANNEKKPIHGRFCSARMASYLDGRIKYYDDGNGNQFIPVEGIYGHKDTNCDPNTDGLKDNEIYGFFIKILNQMPNPLWLYETDLFSNTCPFDVKSQNGEDKFIIYTEAQVRIH